MASLLHPLVGGARMFGYAACMFGYGGGVLCLLERSTDLDQKYRTGRTGLHVALCFAGLSLGCGLGARVVLGAANTEAAVALNAALHVALVGGGVAAVDYVF